MRNLICALLSLGLFSIILGGCSSAKKETAEASPASASATAPASTTSPVDLGASSAGRGI